MQAVNTIHNGGYSFLTVFLCAKGRRPVESTPGRSSFSVPTILVPLSDLTIDGVPRVAINLSTPNGYHSVRSGLRVDGLIGKKTDSDIF